VFARIRELPPWLGILLAGRFVDSAGSNAGLFMTLYLVTQRGLGAEAAGLIVAVSGAASITGNLIGGWFGDRFGLRRSVIAAQVTAAAATAAIPIAPVALIAVLVALSGVIGGASRPLMSALVAVSMPADRRRESIALWRTASNAGVMVGPPICALVAARYFGLIFVADALTTVAMLAIVTSRVPADAHRDSSGGGTSRLWPALRADRSFVLLLATVAVTDAVYRLQYTILPLRLHAAGQPAVLYGLLIAVNGTVIVLGEAALAIRLRGHPATVVIACGFGCVGLGYACFLGPSRGWPGIVLAVIALVVISIGEMLYKPTATAHASDAAPRGMEGRYQSLYGGASIAGTVLTPAIGGFAYVHAPALIWPAGTVLALGAALVLWRGTRSPTGPTRAVPKSAAVPAQAGADMRAMTGTPVSDAVVVPGSAAEPAP